MGDKFFMGCITIAGIAGLSLLGAIIYFIVKAANALMVAVS